MPKYRPIKMLRSSFKDNLFYIWYNDIPKKELVAIIPLEELNKGLKQHGNSNYVLAKAVEFSLEKAIQRWIINSKTEILRDRRQRAWDVNPCVDSLQIDEGVREIRKQATKHKIDLRSWYERGGNTNGIGQLCLSL